MRLKKLRIGNSYTKISLCLSTFVVFAEILYEVFKPPIGISRILWLSVFSISSFLAFLGKRREKNLISTLTFYGNIFILTISLFLFKIVIALMRFFI